MRPRVAIVGLDGATYELIVPWIEAGYLPNFARILRAGVHCDLTSTVPPITGPAWSSFATGKNPGKHGIFGLFKFVPGTYEITPISSTDRKSKDLWELIGEAGKKVIVMNVPITYPVREVNGVLISGFMSPPQARDYAYPPGIPLEVRGVVKDYRVAFEENRLKTERTLSRTAYEDALLDDAFATTEQQAKALFHLMSTHDWDFLITVFKETDTLQHTFWRDMDPSHPRHDPARTAKYGNVIREYYQRIDRILGDFLAKLDDDTTFFLVSDHGFGGFSKYVILNLFLIDQGFLKLKSTPAVLLKRLLFWFGIAPLNVFAVMKRLGLTRFTYSASKHHFRRKAAMLFMSLRDVNWNRSVAYSMGGWGQIYVNLKGREPKGIVDTHEAPALIEKIERELLKLKDPSTGLRVFKPNQIHRKQDAYSGPFVHLSPEIIAIPEPPYKSFPDFEFASNRLFTEASGVSGTHKMEGVFAALGRGIKKGAFVQGATLNDVAPTVLYLLGLPIPSDMDGRVLKNIISDELIEKSPVIVETSSTSQDRESYVFNPVDEEELKESLRKLGYL